MVCTAIAAGNPKLTRIARTNAVERVISCASRRNGTRKGKSSPRMASAARTTKVRLVQLSSASTVASRSATSPQPASETKLTYRRAARFIGSSGEGWCDHRHRQGGPAGPRRESAPRPRPRGALAWISSCLQPLVPGAEHRGESTKAHHRSGEPEKASLHWFLLGRALGRHPVGCAGRLNGRANNRLKGKMPATRLERLKSPDRGPEEGMCCW